MSRYRGISLALVLASLGCEQLVSPHGATGAGSSASGTMASSTSSRPGTSGSAASASHSSSSLAATSGGASASTANSGATATATSGVSGSSGTTSGASTHGSTGATGSTATTPGSSTGGTSSSGAITTGSSGTTSSSGSAAEALLCRPCDVDSPCANNCVNGVCATFCVQSDAGNFCAPACGTTADCASGTACVSLEPSDYPGDENGPYSVCFPAGGSCLGWFPTDGGCPMPCPYGQTCRAHACGAYNALGVGDGTFTSQALPIRLQGTPADLRVADFNRDGVADLVVGENADGGAQIEVLLGLGGGQFASTVYPLLDASLGQLSSVAVGDFTGDGATDIVVGQFAPSAAVFVNWGDGGFAAPTSTPFASSSDYYDAVELADFDGDGLVDLLAYQSGGTVGGAAAEILYSLGDGQFQTNLTTYSGVSWSDGMVFVLPAQIAGQPRSDVYIAANTYGYALSDGQTMQDPQVISGVYAQIPNTQSPYLVTGAVGDLNGDGQQDLVALVNDDSFSEPVLEVAAISYSPGLSTWQWSGLSTSSTASGAVIPNEALFGITTGDFNGDGLLDVAISSMSHFTVLQGNGDGTLRMPTHIGNWPAVNMEVPPYRLVTADFSGDGKLDLATINPDTATVEFAFGN
jgi:hypothetical protein